MKTTKGMTSIWNFLMSHIMNQNGVAGLMGNLYAESALDAMNLQDSGNNKLNMTDLEYTEAVDTGRYSKTKFCYDNLGYGLAQWSSRKRKERLYDYAKETGSSIGTARMQLEFMITELMSSYPDVFRALQIAGSVREASDIVLMKYEKPKNQSDAVKEKREKFGLDILERCYLCPKAKKRYIKVNRDNLCIRREPGKNFKTVAVGLKGDIYEYLEEEKNGWYMIKIDKKEVGWITTKFTNIVEDA